MNKHGIAFWYASSFVFGGVQLVALPLLIPSYTFDLTGSMAHSGGVLSMVGLSGLAAPVIGGLVDRWKMHSQIQLLAVLAYVVAMLILAFAPYIELVYVATAIIGLASVTLLSINPAFIVSAGYDEEEQALRLTRLNQSIFVGAIVTGVLLSLFADAGYTISFSSVAVVAVLGLAVSRLDNREAADRLVAQTRPGDTGSGGKVTLAFVLFLSAVFVAMLASSNQVGQGPNLLQNVFGIDKSTISLALSFSAVISLLTLDIAGRWMKSAGPGPVWILGLAGYLAVSASLYVFAGNSSTPWLLPVLMQLMFLQFMSLVDLVKPAIVVRATNLSPSTTQGVLLGFIAAGYGIGALVGGIAGDVAGLRSVFAVIAAASAAGLLLAVLTLSRLKLSTTTST